MCLTATPAYGRDYKNKTAALADWNDGRDFIIQTIASKWYGKPVSKLDLSVHQEVKIRYNKERNATMTHGGKSCV